MTTECPFCAIAAGTEPAEVVIDTGPLVAFLDNRPIRPGHVQIIPRAHFKTFDQMPEALAAETVVLGQRLARGMKAIYGVARVGFCFSGNDVAHAHAHVVPLHAPTDLTSARYVRGAQPVFGPMPLQRRAEAEAQAALLRSAI